MRVSIRPSVVARQISQQSSPGVLCDSYCGLVFLAPCSSNKPLFSEAFQNRMQRKPRGARHGGKEKTPGSSPARGRERICPGAALIKIAVEGKECQESSTT